MATSQTDLSARVDELITGAWVLAALASAVSGRALTEEHGSVLGAAGYAERTSEGWRLRPAHRAAVEAGPALDALPGHVARILRQAADAAEGRAEEPGQEDDAVLVTQGETSAEHMGELLSLAAARTPGFGAVLRRDGLRFLDVGTGIGAIAATVVAGNPSARAVGLDIQPRALRLAEDHLTRRGVRDRVELRLQDVAELTDIDVYDLAWLPLGVLAPEAACRALPRVLAALRPGGWLIGATALHGTADSQPDHPTENRNIREAVLRWRMARRNITPWNPTELAERLTGVGYRSVKEIETPQHTMAIVLARA